MSLSTLDQTYLTKLLTKRWNNPDITDWMKGYLDGRLDEYCELKNLDLAVVETLQKEIRNGI